MKNLAIIALLVVTVTLGAVCFNLQKQITLGQSQLADAQSQLQKRSDAEANAAQAERKSKALQEALAETAKAAGEKSQQAEQLQKSLADARTNNNAGVTNPFAAMFKDPKMRDMIKASQKMVMGPMIEKQYAALFKQLNLTPEQSAKVKDLLQQKMLASADSGMSLMDDSLDATQRADLAKQNKQQADDYDAQIKEYLGDDNYSAYESYQKTIPDRTAVSQFNDQLGSSAALSDDQQQQLTQAMSDARSNFKWSTDYNNKPPTDGNYASMFTEDKINQHEQEQEQFDQQFLAQAQNILTPDQLTALKEFQKQRLAMQTASMKMAAGMFGPKTQ
ncbi:MAG TPA: hypothetical protein VGO57_02935 [Verrucomicrobiae bacterium]|jgi:hypothetical protein